MKRTLTLSLAAILFCLPIHASRVFDPSQTGANTQVIITPASSVYNNLAAMTISFWFYPTGPGSGGNGYSHVIAKNGSIAIPQKLFYYYSFDINNDAKGMIWEFDISYSGLDTGWFFQTSGSTTRGPHYNQWNHVILTWPNPGGAEASGTWVKMFWQGTRSYMNTANLDIEIPYFSDSSGNEATGSPDDDSADGWYFGSASSSGANGPYIMAGRLAEVAIFNRILTFSEITSLHNSTTGVPGSLTSSLAGYWHLCGNASPEPDSSGNGNSGVLSSNPPTKGADSPGYSCATQQSPRGIQSPRAIQTPRSIQVPN